MADHDPRSTALSASVRRAIEAIPDAPEPVFDANGFDPNDFDWRPVPRRPRADGWTPDVQRQFVEALADTGMVSAAAQAVDMSVTSCYRLRRAAGSESFARAWDAALDAAADRLTDLAFTRAIEGEEVPVFDADGCRTGAKWRYNDRLMMFLLRAYRPDRFRHAHESVRRPDEPSPPASVPVVRALAALTPVTPPEPHRLMPPEQLAEEIGVARALAEVAELYPPDDRERFRHPRRPDDHPRALHRRSRRHAREARRDDREAAQAADSGDALD